MSKKQKLTPMMEQYFSIKETCPDAILFFRLGDFYEMFYDDAVTASRVLEITLTSRDRKAENPIPMCGVPHHSATEYIKNLVEAGYKVAICEQVEDSKTTKGMVKREIVRIVTPGTIMEEGAVSNKENNYLAATLKYADTFYLTYVDISTGEIFLTQTDDEGLFLDELHSVEPSEIIIGPGISEEYGQKIKDEVSTYYSEFEPDSDLLSKARIWQLSDATEAETKVLDYICAYLYSVQKQSLEHIQPVERYEIKNYLQMNYYAKRQLELTKSMRSGRRDGSLLSLIDKTETAMGGRLLHQWLERPLLKKAPLVERHDRVENLLNSYFERLDLIECFSKVYDLERLVTKISISSANARDLDQLRFSLKQVKPINHILKLINEKSQNETKFDLLNEFSELVELLDNVLVEDPPVSVTEGGVIKDGWNSDLDRYRDALENGQKWLADLQQREKEKTGLSTLKIGYNKVFGYFIEVSRKQAEELDDSLYERKQTLANTERFITEELKEIEATILGAQDKIEGLEYSLFVELRDKVSEYSSQLQLLASQIAELDVLANFATISEEEDYTRAEISDQKRDFYLKDSRHPVVEKIVGRSNFVANDLEVEPDKYLLLLTGPNMSGKSTYMRQVAFCVILNQMGCFVPAKKARLPLVDQIFTRIGSADDISVGQSTFMVEMMESNHALRKATENSLLLFDELGRGTATYDGMALAGAIIKYISEKVKATTIFSTHYHELTELEDTIPALVNIHVGAEEHDGDLIFLYRILKGPADKSYGIHVAKLAGLPDSLIQDASVILEELESNRHDFSKPQVEQLSLFDYVGEAGSTGEEKPSAVEEEIMELDVNNLTPIEALQTLSRLQKELKEL